MLVTGGCMCGQLRYEIEAQTPLVARVCWCRDCQYVGAGTGTANAVFPKAALSVNGERATFESLAASGSKMRRTFGSSRKEGASIRAGFNRNRASREGFSTCPRWRPR